jgi:hypothetical protein
MMKLLRNCKNFMLELGNTIKAFRKYKIGKVK